MKLRNFKLQKYKHFCIITLENLTTQYTATMQQPASNMDSARPHPQWDSPLFQLPQELRNMIYTQLFLSTRLTHGVTKRRLYRFQYWYCFVRMVPAQNALAFLRTCRRTKPEIGESWLGEVLFNFEDIRTMLDKIASLSVGTLSKIRHLRFVVIYYGLVVHRISATTSAQP
jgi:hypothetical protein